MLDSTLFSLLSLTGVGFISSFLGGMLGLGGGFILIPIISLFLGIDMRRAVLISLISLLILSLIKCIQNKALIERYRQLISTLAFMSVSGSILSAFIATAVSVTFLNYAFGILSIAIGLQMFADRDWLPPASAHESVKRPGVLTRGIFFLSGSLGGLLGLGGGVLNVPALHRLLHIKMSEATQLNFPFVAFSAVSALSVFYFRDRAEIQQIPLIPLGALLVGTLLGAHYSKKAKISSRSLKILFGILLGILGLMKILKA